MCRHLHRNLQRLVQNQQMLSNFPYKNSLYWESCPENFFHRLYFFENKGESIVPPKLSVQCFLNAFFNIVNNKFIVNSRCFPNNLAIKPTSRAAIMVPSRTPFNFPQKIKERIPAITVMEESNMIFVVPDIRQIQARCSLPEGQPASLHNFRDLPRKTDIFLTYSFLSPCKFA